MYIHISYHILDFVQQMKTIFTMQSLTYCLSYIYTIPADALAT